MTPLEEAAASVVKHALASNLTLITAESCTAGALASLIAQVPDAGKVLHGGFVVYTKTNKTAALGVPAHLLATKTAVSKEVAEAMAAGALQRSPADIAISITGVAGPEPDEDGNEVGLVFVSVAVRDKPPVTNRYAFGNCSFADIRDRSLAEALQLIDTSIGGRGVA